MLPLLDEPFLRAQWDAEFQAFNASPVAAALLERLRAWAGRAVLNERASETAFIQRFFVETWGYRLQGHAQSGAPFTCRPQFELPGAGQAGGNGFADLALGHFGAGGDDIAPNVTSLRRRGSDVRSRAWLALVACVIPSETSAISFAVWRRSASHIPKR